MSISLSFATLLQGKLKITAIEFDQPNLWIERNPETGKFNLQSGSTRSVSTRSGLAPQWLKIEKVAIEGGNILYQGQGPESDWAFGIHRVAMESAREDPHTRVQVRGDLDGMDLVLAGKLGSSEAILGSMETAVELEGYLKKPGKPVQSFRCHPGHSKMAWREPMGESRSARFGGFLGCCRFFPASTQEYFSDLGTGASRKESRP